MPRPRPERPQLKRHDGKWVIHWWDRGERRRLSTGATDENGARQALIDFEAQLVARPSNLELGDALDRYILSRTGKVEALGRLKDAAGALRMGLGHLRLNQINQAQWDRYAQQRVTRPGRRQTEETHKPRPVSTGTLRREFNVLRATLRQAWKDNLLDKPPVLEAPADSAPRDRYLTKAEAKRLLEACITPHVRTFLALALYTGARKGSILALTWDRVDFVNNMVDFQEPGRRITAKRRPNVPINPQLRVELENARAIAQTPYVVEFNGKPVPFGLRWSWQRLCERAGLTWLPTPHHMKHSVASWFAMEGVPIDQAADWLATDPKTLRKTYRKFDPTYLRPVIRALDL
jgi:integrase